MPSFHNGAVEIAYLDEGEGEPIVLVHGFASTKSVNWVYPTWVSELRKDGRRVIALDNRGHGESSKLYDPAQYSIAAMAGDVVALMDHLEIARADIMGYSLGARMTAWLALNARPRLRAAIFGGIGMAMIEGGGPGENVAAALEAPSLDEVSRSRRADVPGLCRPDSLRPACARRLPARLAWIDEQGRGGPHCVAGPDRSRHRGRNRRLRRGARPDHRGAEVLDIPNRDHMRAVGDKVYKAGVVDFLSRRP